MKVNLVASNNQPESRMREIRQSGSVGGESPITATSLPQSLGRRYATKTYATKTKESEG